MSRNIFYYEKVEPQTAFLAGVADISLNELTNALDNSAISLESDIFYVGSAAIDGIYDAVLERLKIYNAIDKHELDLEKDAFMPNLPLAKVSGNNIIDSLTKELYPQYTKSKTLKSSISSFYYSLSWYLNPAKKLWKTDMQILREYMPSLEEALAMDYTFIVSDIYFLEFKNYIYMLVVGSDE